RHARGSSGSADLAPVDKIGVIILDRVFSVFLQFFSRGEVPKETGDALDLELQLFLGNLVSDSSDACDSAVLRAGNTSHLGKRIEPALKSLVPRNGNLVVTPREFDADVLAAEFCRTQGCRAGSVERVQ